MSKLLLVLFLIILFYLFFQQTEYFGTSGGTLTQLYARDPQDSYEMVGDFNDNYCNYGSCQERKRMN